MESTLKILDAAGAQIKPEVIEIGENVYKRGVTSGIDQDGWDSLERTSLFLKAPITTPLGGGVKSLNVTVRKTLGLYANVRPVVSFHPFVPALHKHIDMLIVRENEEDCCKSCFVCFVPFLFVSSVFSSGAIANTNTQTNASCSHLLSLTLAFFLLLLFPHPPS